MFVGLFFISDIKYVIRLTLKLCCMVAESNKITSALFITPYSMCENDNMMIMKGYRNIYEINITHYLDATTMYFHTLNLLDKEIFFW